MKLRGTELNCRDWNQFEANTIKEVYFLRRHDLQANENQLYIGFENSCVVHESREGCNSNDCLRRCPVIIQS
jgi:hypothetical protein